MLLGLQFQESYIVFGTRSDRTAARGFIVFLEMSTGVLVSCGNIVFGGISSFSHSREILHRHVSIVQASVLAVARPPQID